jgi:hypothetical protein
MSRVEIDYLGEGRSDDAIARKLIVAATGVPGTSYRRPQAGPGKVSLDRRLAGLNAGVAYGKPVLVLRDLNSDAVCPGALLAHLLPNRHERLLLRICVRVSETWLMADREAYARFFGVSGSQIPRDPETLRDPKQTILGWVDDRRAAKLSRHVDDGRRRGVPDWAILGEWHGLFAEKVWNPTRAANAGTAPSLTRALRRLEALVANARREIQEL